MSKRGAARQTMHDQAVEKRAEQLVRVGWQVKAAIPGFVQPTPIGKHGRIPDIEASKAGATRLIEIETPGTMTDHGDQHETFRRSAGQRERTTFEVEEVKPK